MQVFINIVSTFVVLFGVFWALFPGGFGLLNFKKSHTPPLIYIAMAAWGVLLLTHLFVLYEIWFGQGAVYWWLFFLLCMHIMFFSIFGRDVGTG